jgi:hypothetical protein
MTAILCRPCPTFFTTTFFDDMTFFNCEVSPPLSQIGFGSCVSLDVHLSRFAVGLSQRSELLRAVVTSTMCA